MVGRSDNLNTSGSIITMDSQSDLDDAPSANPRTVIAILDVIHRHLGVQVEESSTSADSEGLAITPDFLFAVCAILSSGQTDPAPVLLAVLRCLRHTWRAQPSHTRSFSALARELAAISSSSLLSHTPATTCQQSSHTGFLDSQSVIVSGPDHIQDTGVVKMMPETVQACENGRAVWRRPRNSVFEPLKPGTPLRDLRTQTPRPVAPHRARRAVREHIFSSTDENEPPIYTPSKLRHAINGAATTSALESYSLLGLHCHPGENTPTRHVFQSKNS